MKSKINSKIAFSLLAFLILTLTSNACDFPEFLEGVNRSYSDGDIISRNGKDYRVLVAGWANQGGADAHYAPGTGSSWSLAWALENDPCVGGDNTTGCSVPVFIEDADRNYSQGEIVKRNGFFYEVKVASWANSNASDLYYAPATGLAWEEAWLVSANPCDNNNGNNNHIDTTLINTMCRRHICELIEMIKTKDLSSAVLHFDNSQAYSDFFNVVSDSEVEIDVVQTSDNQLTLMGSSGEVTILDLTINETNGLISGVNWTNPENIISDDSNTSGNNRVYSLPIERNGSIKLPYSRQTGNSIYSTNSLQGISNENVVESDLLDIQSFPSIDYQYEDILGILHNESYDPGQVISNLDIPESILQNFIASSLFGKVSDAANYIKDGETDADGLPIGTGVFVDSERARLVIYNYGSEMQFYGNNPGDHTFGRPIAAKVVGDYLFVLDNYRNMISSFKFVSSSNSTVRIDLEYLGETDFGIPFSSLKDISGISKDDGSLFLLVGDENYIWKFCVKGHSGGSGEGIELVGGSSVEKIDGFVFPENLDQRVNLSGVRRLDVSGVQDSYAGQIVVITESNEIIAFTANDFRKEIHNVASGTEIATSYIKLTDEFYPNNLSYHLGNNCWYVSDYNNQIHSLTTNGEYVGTVKGVGVLNHPVAISQNLKTLRSDFVVINEWGENSGLSYFDPRFSFEIMGVNENGATNTVSIDYVVTAPIDGRNIEISLNNEIYSLPESQIVPNSMTSFTLTSTNWREKGLIPGWNNFTLTIGLESKSISFFWIPNDVAVIGDNPSCFNSSSFDHASKPVFIYKDVVVNGCPSGFFLGAGQTYFSEDAHLIFKEDAIYTVLNEEFFFENGSGIMVYSKGINNVITGCTFDGQNKTKDLVKYKWIGEPGQEINTRSYLNSCTFANFLGTGLSVENVPNLLLVNNVFRSFNKGAANGLTTTGLSLQGVNNADIFGCNFETNDIGISSNYVGMLNLRPMGNTNIDELLITSSVNTFRDNTIGVDAFMTNISSNGALLEQEKVAFQLYEGTYNLNTNLPWNAYNTEFRNNEYGILFNGDLQLDGGYNLFWYNSKSDVSYLGSYESAHSSDYFPTSGNVIPSKFNWECNQWANSVTGCYGYQPPLFKTLGVSNGYISENHIYDFSPFAVNSYLCTGTMEYESHQVPTEFNVNGESVYDLFKTARASMSRNNYGNAATLLKTGIDAIELNQGQETLNSTAKRLYQQAYKNYLDALIYLWNNGENKQPEIELLKQNVTSNLDIEGFNNLNWVLQLLHINVILGDINSAKNLLSEFNSTLYSNNQFTSLDDAKKIYSFTKSKAFVQSFEKEGIVTEDILFKSSSTLSMNYMNYVIQSDDVSESIECDEEASYKKENEDELEIQPSVVTDNSTVEVEFNPEESATDAEEINNSYNISIVDLMGRTVVDLGTKELSEMNSFQFNASELGNVSSGRYFVLLRNELSSNIIRKDFVYVK